MGRNPSYVPSEPRVIIVEDYTKSEKKALKASGYEFVDDSKKVMKKKSLLKRIFG